MSLFRQLTVKPWLTEGVEAEDGIRDGPAFLLPTAKVGLRVFLAVVMVVFSILVAAYTERMEFPDWHSLAAPWLLWPNTVILVLSSVALQWAWVSGRRGRMDRVRRGLSAGGVLTFAFLVGQLLVWRELVASGQYASTNPANGFFYLLTALHGLHLLGGLVAWGRTTAKLRRGDDAARVLLSVELCAIYWHFLLLIWLVLFALLSLT